MARVLKKFVNARGIFKGVRGVHTEKPAPIGPEHLDGLKGRHRPDHDGLRFCLALVRGSHGSWFERRDIMRALKGHGTALYQKNRERRQGLSAGTYRPATRHMSTKEVADEGRREKPG